MKDIVVYLGELDTQDSGKVHEPWPAEKHSINRKIIHPHFKFRIAQPGTTNDPQQTPNILKIVRFALHFIFFRSIWFGFATAHNSNNFHVSLTFGSYISIAQ